MLMRKRRFETSAVDVFLAASVSFFSFSVLWWVAEWFQRGSGLGRSVSLILVAVVCLLQGYNTYRIGRLPGLAALLPAFVIVAMERDIESACLAVLIPVLGGWLVKTEELDSGFGQDR